VLETNISWNSSTRFLNVSSSCSLTAFPNCIVEINSFSLSSSVSSSTSSPSSRISNGNELFKSSILTTLLDSSSPYFSSQASIL
jgi:hypothetical protein